MPMTDTEKELSTKLLNAQKLGLQTLEIVMIQQKELDLLKLRMDQLGAEFEAYCIANPRRQV